MKGRAYAKAQARMLYFSQLIVEREVLVVDHPGCQAAEMKEVGWDPFPLLAKENDKSGDGAATAKDAARAESKTEASMSGKRKERRV